MGNTERNLENGEVERKCQQKWYTLLSSNESLVEHLGFACPVKLHYILQDTNVFLQSYTR